MSSWLGFDAKDLTRQGVRLIDCAMPLHSVREAIAGLASAIPSNSFANAAQFGVGSYSLYCGKKAIADCPA